MDTDTSGWLMTREEASDEAFLNRVQSCVPFWNDVILNPGKHKLHVHNAACRSMHMFTLTRNRHVARLEARTAWFKEKEAECLKAAKIAEAQMEGDRRARMRAAGLSVPVQEKPPEAPDSEVKSCEDGEGQRRRKRALEKRRGVVEIKEELPSASVLEKDNSRKRLRTMRKRTH